jgi:hypothetical protein
MPNNLLEAPMIDREEKGSRGHQGSEIDEEDGEHPDVAVFPVRRLEPEKESVAGA